MLSNEDKNHLLLLYTQFERMNDHIRNLILNNSWDDTDIAIQEKNALQKQILIFEKPRKEDIKKTPELDEFRKKLIQIEFENIELVKKARENLEAEILNIKKTKKVIGAYEPQLNNAISTFVKDEDD